MELSYPSVVKDAQKNFLIKTPLMSTHNISFCLFDLILYIPVNNCPVKSMPLCHIRFCSFVRFEVLRL